MWLTEAILLLLPPAPGPHAESSYRLPHPHTHTLHAAQYSRMETTVLPLDQRLFNQGRKNRTDHGLCFALQLFSLLHVRVSLLSAKNKEDRCGSHKPKKSTWGQEKRKRRGGVAGRREGAGLTCQASLVASLVYSYHLAKKALGKGLQLLQKTPLKHMHITPSVDSPPRAQESSVPSKSE